MPEDDIKRIEAVLTIVGGKIVYGSAEFASLSPPPLPVMPEWSPVSRFGGYSKPQLANPGDPGSHLHRDAAMPHAHSGLPQLWGSGCDCYGF